MIKKLFIFISFIFLLAFKKEDCLVYYTHNGITITRLNLNNEIRFYYGKFTNKNKLPESYIQASSLTDTYKVISFLENQEKSRW